MQPIILNLETLISALWNIGHEDLEEVKSRWSDAVHEEDMIVLKNHGKLTGLLSLIETMEVPAEHRAALAEAVDGAITRVTQQFLGKWITNALRLEGEPLYDLAQGVIRKLRADQSEPRAEVRC